MRRQSQNCNAILLFLEFCFIYVLDLRVLPQKLGCQFLAGWECKKLENKQYMWFCCLSWSMLFVLQPGRHMQVHAHAHTHTCLLARMYACTYAHSHVCTDRHMLAYPHVYRHPYMHSLLHTNTLVPLHPCIACTVTHIHIRIHVLTCARVHVFTHVRTLIVELTLSLQSVQFKYK